MAIQIRGRIIGDKNVLDGLVSVPTSLTTVTTVNTWLHSLFVANNTGAAIVLTVTNGAGTGFAVSLAANSLTDMNLKDSSPLFQGGLKWQAGGAGLVAFLGATVDG